MIYSDPDPDPAILGPEQGGLLHSAFGEVLSFFRAYICRLISVTVNE